MSARRSCELPPHIFVSQLFIKFFLACSFPRREDVERSNTRRMQDIQSETRMYTASDGGALAGTEQGTKMLLNFMAPQQLTLKIGAQVPLFLSYHPSEMEVDQSCCSGDVNQEYG